MNNHAHSHSHRGMVPAPLTTVSSNDRMSIITYCCKFMLKSLVNTNPLSPPSTVWAVFIFCGEEAEEVAEEADGWNTGTTEVTSSCGDRKKQHRAD